MVSGFIKGRHAVYLEVFEENSDGSKGRQIDGIDQIDRDQFILLQTEHGRIVYHYKYEEDDDWNTDVHSPCRGDRDHATAIPT